MAESHLIAGQFEQLKTLLDAVVPRNPFYLRKLGTPTLETIADLRRLPFTTKAEFVADQAEHPPYGTNQTDPAHHYARFHQTSGTTTGKPLCWLDTSGSWLSLLDTWQVIFAKIGITNRDTLFFPFSFGPFLGFWTAFEAAVKVGYRCLSGGGMSSIARLKFHVEHRATVIFATPTYALHLLEIAEKEKVNLAVSSVRLLVLAGEPGGNIPATRKRIEDGWGAKVVDHYGTTEVGPVAVETSEHPGCLEILDEYYLAEVIDPTTLEPTDMGELVLTNLTRTACPTIRFRTGDLVRRKPGVHKTILEGGILGRADEMLHIRGNNVYPTAIEAIIRRFDVSEYRLIVRKQDAMTELRIEIESPSDNAANAIQRAIQETLLFRADVVQVPSSSLPRFEMKSKRLVVE